MYGNVRAALFKSISKSAVDLRNYIQDKKLSASPGYSATLLHHKSGALKRSITEQVVNTEQGIYAHVFSAGDVKYAAIHEYGGAITRFGKKVGDYTVRMPMRSFMRTSLAENKDKIIAGINKAAMDGVRQ